MTDIKSPTFEELEIQSMRNRMKKIDKEVKANDVLRIKLFNAKDELRAKLRVPIAKNYIGKKIRENDESFGVTYMEVLGVADQNGVLQIRTYHCRDDSPYGDMSMISNGILVYDEEYDENNAKYSFCDDKEFEKHKERVLRALGLK